MKWWKASRTFKLLIFGHILSYFADPLPKRFSRFSYNFKIIIIINFLHAECNGREACRAFAGLKIPKLRVRYTHHNFEQKFSWFQKLCMIYYQFQFDLMCESSQIYRVFPLNLTSFAHKYKLKLIIVSKIFLKNFLVSKIKTIQKHGAYILPEIGTEPNRTVEPRFGSVPRFRFDSVRFGTEPNRTAVPNGKI